LSPAQPLSDQAVFDLFPEVMIDRDNIEHYRALAQGRLLINRCEECGYWIYPHRPLCPRCLSWRVTPTEVSGRGRIFTYTLLHQLRDPDALVVEPVVEAAVELAEQPGLRYLARIVGCPRDQLALDMPVELAWIEERGRPAPVFAPAGAASRADG
jgi:uncharacterized OB-fold protein